MKNIACNGQRKPKLCSVCGPNVNTEDVVFSQREANLVYMDKVYSYNKATSCPILQAITGCRCNGFTVQTKLLPIDDGCGCESECGCNHQGCCCPTTNTCTIGADSTFEITRSYVIVKSLTLEEGTLDTSDVTVNGIEVDSLTNTGNQYIATAETAMTETANSRCTDLSLPTKSYFLITGAGPWNLVGTIVIEGTVSTAGRTCCFQGKFETPSCGLTINGTSSFAVPKLAIPCTTGGISPKISFNFTGSTFILNPSITVSGSDCTGFILTLTGSLAVQPQLNIEVSRRTLFCLDACEGLLPCDGTEAAYELEDDDCTWPPKPACSCGTVPSPINDENLCDPSPICDFDKNSCNCGSNRRKHDHENQQGVGGCSCSNSNSNHSIANNESNVGTTRSRHDAYGSMQWNGCNGCNSW